MAFKLFSKDSTAFPQEKRQRFLMIILVVMVLAILITVYFYFLRPSQPSTTQPEISPSTSPVIGRGITIEDIINKINFDINFLKSPYFLTLKIYGEWPLEIEEKGRINPFLPLSY